MNKQIDIRRHAPAATDAWRGFRQEMDRLFDRFSDGFESFALEPFRLLGPAPGGSAPLAVEVTDNEKAYTITAELPGVDEKNVDVSVSDDMLVIKGEKRQEKEDKDKNLYVSERSYGSFRRLFSLPRGTDASKIEARFHNGLLTVTVPKGAEKQDGSRKIPIKGV